MSELEVRPAAAPIGAEIIGADLSRGASDAQIEAIVDALDRHGVVVLRDQDITPAQQVAFARRFGTPQVNVRAEANSEELPEIFWISNVTRDGKPVGSHDAGRYWHSDLCYLERPSYVTMLYGIEIPEVDGEPRGATCFASASAAYDALDEAMKARLAGLEAANGYRFMWNRKAREFGQRPVLSEAELERFPPDAIHPVVRTHPRTGRKCLYVCDGYTHRIVGLDARESDELLAGLFVHATDEAFVHRHHWRPGDVLMWDNCSVQHRATYDYPAGARRLMRRCTVEGTITR